MGASTWSLEGDCGIRLHDPVALLTYGGRAPRGSPDKSWIAPVSQRNAPGEEGDMRT